MMRHGDGERRAVLIDWNGEYWDEAFWACGFAAFFFGLDCLHRLHTGRWLYQEDLDRYAERLVDWIFRKRG